MIEKQIQKQIIDYLNKRKIYNFKVIQANKNGIPDLICCYKGIFVAFEVKSEKGKVSQLQLRQKKCIENADGICEIVRSVADVENVLSSICNFEKNKL